MTKTIISFLFVLCTLSVSAAKNPVIWEKPIYLSTSISHLQLKSVEFHDTATIVKASITNPKIWILSHIHLYGDDGNNYKLKFIKEFAPQKHIPIDKHGVATMTLVFEPMPLNTQFFDMLEGFAKYENRVLGISKAKNPVKIKPYAINEEKVKAFRKDFFRTDTACIKGKIERYSRSAKRSSLKIDHRNNLTGRNAPITIPINKDGTFEHKFILHYPILDYLTGDIPFLIKPGETICFTINRNNKATVSDPSGKPTEYSAITSRMPIYYTDSKDKALTGKAGLYGFKNYCKLVEETYNNAIATHDYLADRFHYNDIEYIMGKINIQVAYAEKIGQYYRDNEKTQNASLYELENLPDSLKDILTPENYSFLREIPFNDPLTLSVPMYFYFAHNMMLSHIFDRGTGYFEDSEDSQSKEKWFIPYEDSIVDSIRMCTDKAIFGGEETSLPMKIKYLNEFYRESREGNYNFITFKNDFIKHYPADSVDIMINERIEKIKRRANTIKAAFHNPVFESLIDEYVNYGLNDKQISYPLPDCEATTLLKKITDKYKGKYLYIDFWGPGCAACIRGIKSSKAWREELRNNPDFEFIFITGDNFSPKKRYDEYIATILNGAEVYLVPENEFKKYMELFKFLAIPHYEALDRNGNKLKINKKYNVGGKEQFLKNIELLKKLEK